MKKEEDFSEWYNEIVEETGLTDKRYPIKGMNVWPAYGWKTMLLINAAIRREFDSRGHDEVYFPLLIPEDQFQKEKEHIKGFDAQVFWVTKAGSNDLDVDLLLRPTSETAMYPVFSLWIRSHADLPLRVYQIVNTFRYETKQTRAFIRVREIQFIEGHTCHATFEEAEAQIEEDLDIMRSVAADLCIPYRVIRRIEWDKFPGAYYTLGVDTMLPDGRALQIASIHQYRTNFSLPYEIFFEETDGSRKPVHQTTYGMSERMLGAVVAIHGDDKGLVMPPAVAPIQILVVPIPAKGNAESIYAEARKLAKHINNHGLRAHADERDIRPGNKFYYWERKGVPIRLELGKREIDEGFVTAVRRDSGKKTRISASDIIRELGVLLKEMASSMLKKAEEEVKSKEFDVHDPSAIKDGYNRMQWCGLELCGRKIEELSGASLLGTIPGEKRSGGKCIICGAATEYVVYVAKTM
ncbi:MAG: proline--tRNA ligase [Thermoplasmata archaeon]|nr:proline--tRNA ligase [Candidatus Sysuiplasma acidicola]MBX8646459.1 proline--tRNA ligase [Candidatus Sysuiplasma acidicola]MDH2905770.1 proline--tRNA ligase [Methanomassiliicoccales archaeon]